MSGRTVETISTELADRIFDRLAATAEGEPLSATDARDLVADLILERRADALVDRMRRATLGSGCSDRRRELVSLVSQIVDLAAEPERAR